MTSVELYKANLTLFFAQNLLTMVEDPRAFEKMCKAKAQRDWAAKNPEKKAANDRASYERHKDSRLKKMADYAQENPEIVQAAKRAYYDRNTQLCKDRATTHRRSEAGKAWMRQWMEDKRNNDPAFRLLQNMRSRIWHALFSQKATKAAGGLELLGVASKEEFFEKISSTLPANWNWDNYGTVWELDHKRPCASFDMTNAEQQKQCFHWSNYQPLSIPDNRSKGAKWEGA